MEEKNFIETKGKTKKKKEQSLHIKLQNNNNHNQKIKVTNYIYKILKSKYNPKYWTRNP